MKQNPKVNSSTTEPEGDLASLLCDLGHFFKGIESSNVGKTNHSMKTFVKAAIVYTFLEEGPSGFELDREKLKAGLIKTVEPFLKQKGIRYDHLMKSLGDEIKYIKDKKFEYLFAEDNQKIILRKEISNLLKHEKLETMIFRPKEIFERVERLMDDINSLIENNDIFKNEWDWGFYLECLLEPYLHFNINSALELSPPGRIEDSIRSFLEIHEKVQPG